MFACPIILSLPEPLEKKHNKKKSACKLFSVYIVQREIKSAQLYTVLEELRSSSQNCANTVTFILYSPLLHPYHQVFTVLSVNAEKRERQH